MKKLFPKPFYRSCPTCRRRMRRVGCSGDDVRSCVIDYECRCGEHWSYAVGRNVMQRGWSQEYPDKASTVAQKPGSQPGDFGAKQCAHANGTHSGHKITDVGKESAVDETVRNSIRKTF